MKPVTTFLVSPTLPDSLRPLKELAYNLWWCWNADATELFYRIDANVWEAVHHNPVALLSRVSHDRLLELAARPEYTSQLERVYQEFRDYIEGPTWYQEHHGPHSEWIAYFCAEFGIHESFSCYSGGLGVLAGDHLKSASDLGLPLVGVGLLYQEGYFSQYLTQNGWQNERYNEIDFHLLPLTPITQASGAPLTIAVELPDGPCYARLWKMNVGRVPLYLLDTNIPDNTLDVHRDVTDRLYGGVVDDRVRQEIMLGIGGVRALDAIGIEPSVIHINEGHAAFSMLERARMTMERLSLTFDEAWNAVRAGSVFTTHTPVPAGNEIFHHDTMRTFFESYVTSLGISWDHFLELGAPSRTTLEDGFSMTVLGLKGASFRNGVSQLHGHVARTMWHSVWDGFTLDDVPITGITNGVHTATWVAREMAELYDRYLGRAWRLSPEQESAWKNVGAIPDVELWRAHTRRRERLVLGARDHILHKHAASITEEQAANINACLDPDVLTIGFARRFASYKRADLLMRDMHRLAKIVLNADKPVQIIMAGKAHPRDVEGKELLQRVLHAVREHGLHRRIVFLEDYDMAVARLMVRGCDVWLNTPRRPYEASGTSGMKCVLNGGIHFSVLDGWWAEAYNGENGFAIGRGEEFDNATQDAADSETLYDVLEHSIVPRFYERRHNRVPEEWTALMKRSISSLAWRFAARRMVRDYAVDCYMPAMNDWATATANNGDVARSLYGWAQVAKAAWDSVAVANVAVHGATEVNVGKRIHVSADVVLPGLSPADVIVQAVYGHVDSKGEISPASFAMMQPVATHGQTTRYEGSYVCTESGLQGCTVRVVAAHPHVRHLADSHLVHIADSSST
jgi:starch phosphorylase